MHKGYRKPTKAEKVSLEALLKPFCKDVKLIGIKLYDEKK